MMGDGWIKAKYCQVGKEVYQVCILMPYDFKKQFINFMKITSVYDMVQGDRDMNNEFKIYMIYFISDPMLCMLLLLSRFSRVRLCATPQMAAHQAPPSKGFSRQEYWSGVPLSTLNKTYQNSRYSVIKAKQTGNDKIQANNKLAGKYLFPFYQ